MKTVYSGKLTEGFVGAFHITIKKQYHEINYK